MPKILPILLLSVILPTADVGTDLALIIKLYTGLNYQYFCDMNDDDENFNEYFDCQLIFGPDQYCTPEKVSNKNTVCRLKKSDSQYFCRTLVNTAYKDYIQCTQNATKYCSDPATNHNVCDAASHPKIASSLSFFFLLNYVSGLVTCVRLEGRKWIPFISALFIVYPQYCKKLKSNI